MTINQLHSLYLKSSGISTDTRKIQKNNLFFALKGDNFDGNSYAEEAIRLGASYSVIDNEDFHVLNGKTILVNDVLVTLQKLANFHRSNLAIPIIALTGSNGKTTTKELINAVLKQKFNVIATSGNLNNHIGVPLTLLSMDKSTEFGIVEMGANHQGEIAQLCKIAQPDFGYITNFGKAHLEGFGSLEGVIKGKSELYDYLRSNEKFVFVNREDKTQIEKTKDIKQFSFGVLDSKSDVEIELLETDPFVRINFSNTEISTSLIGNYNFSNICAAVAIGHYFKIPLQSIKQGIEGYIPENNRSQLISKGSNKIILDAYNANPTSLKAAIETFHTLKSNNKILILGDMFELGNDSEAEHQNIVDLIEQLNFKAVYLTGKNFSKTTSPHTLRFESFESLKEFLKQNPINNAHILLKGSRGMALERVLEYL
ncbi:UDP-N-acetylmuramoyl-tripeptide--D-alanyl-D-alanine ligase [Planktosalinus lacus]|uniref:UDP-N-acetylmuramoyl-tripeptide--D-alanyl-D-alanine ligase n=1 Tax=Planktosalinus lacus TaxID=1526573 RepID=A0A8J2Y5Q1_9FLAO|nr:UDP-N-acetylmuramoyl-tripeptide--D-alanyl-D-alanine ligase [Planktosalinus lacus]GGD86973.1 UDP-N-acetylmuramoyl-tripeptide--D-alanyl-D-alanine ligase [Planktosalinus lacus]